MAQPKEYRPGLPGNDEPLAPASRAVRPAWLRYFAAALLVAVASSVRAGLLSALGTSSPFVTVYPAVVLAALFGGLGPGLVAALLSAFVASFWMEPAGIPFVVRNPVDWQLLAAFLISCVMISGICEAMHRARARGARGEARARLAKELRESEETFRSLFDRAAVPTAVQGPDGYILRTNPAYCQFFGYSEEELRTLTVLDLTHPGDRELKTPMRQMLTGELSRYHMEKRYLHKDGHTLWGDLNVSLVRDAQGTPLYFIVQIQDITERKLMERQLYFFKNLMEHSQEPFHVLDPQDGFRFIYINPAACRHFGWPEEKLLTMRVPEWDPIYTLELCEALWRQVKAEGSCIIETIHRHANGHESPVEVAVNCIEYEGHEYVGGFVHDITIRKQAEDALRVANAALTEADHRKDEFLAMLAHELRNPLAPVRNAVHILRAIGSKDSAALRQQDIIDRQVTHMARLLDDLLDVSRVTRGKIILQRQPLHLVDVLAHAVETATPLAQARHHKLHYTPPSDTLRVEGDLDRLAQVVGNLLVNAIKYTNEGGQIWLEAGSKAGQAVIRVRDSGIGISPEMLPHVFELFTQVDQSLGRAQGGLGIGLTMVKRLMELHGGSVEARSDGLGRGSEFVIRLPALPCEVRAPAASEEREEPAPEARLRRILVVDDLVDSAESLAEMLRLFGHEVRTAHDGPTVLNDLGGFMPDVVLLDIGMPGMDGYEVARRLRQKDCGRKTLLVALTGYAQESDRAAARAAGFDHHLSKPVDLDTLRELLVQSALPCS